MTIILRKDVCFLIWASSNTVMLKFLPVLGFFLRAKPDSSIEANWIREAKALYAQEDGHPCLPGKRPLGDQMGQ